jgi:hypothetical protein
MTLSGTSPGPRRCNRDPPRPRPSSPVLILACAPSHSPPLPIGVKCRCFLPPGTTPMPRSTPKVSRVGPKVSPDAAPSVLKAPVARRPELFILRIFRMIHVKLDCE